ncbi:MAG: ribonuclease HII [Sediminibacterium sp.]|nr:ribonuclease HII [Sediminibacterium sp.]
MFNQFSENDILEVGCDEAGRGSYIGAVFAAAVILPPKLKIDKLNDSKKLNAGLREQLAKIIKENAIAWAVSSVNEQEIDSINILQASIKAMHLAIDKLPISPQFIVVDGNKFKPYKNIPFKTIIKGDSLYANIAAASILAKTTRDQYVLELHHQYPDYCWDKNKGYGTEKHRSIIKKIGVSPYHRKSFNI